MFKDTLQEEIFFLVYYGKFAVCDIMKLTPRDRAWLVDLVQQMV